MRHCKELEHADKFFTIERDNPRRIVMQSAIPDRSCTRPPPADFYALQLGAAARPAGRSTCWALRLDLLGAAARPAGRCGSTCWALRLDLLGARPAGRSTCWALRLDLLGVK